jgi:hypothetical protein
LKKNKLIRIEIKKDLEILQVQSEVKFKVHTRPPAASGRRGILRSLVRGAGSVLDLAGTPDPELRRRVYTIKKLTPTGALLQDQTVLRTDLERAARKAKKELKLGSTG